MAASLAEQVPARRHQDRGHHHGAVAGARPAVPREWSDRISDFFAAATLTGLDGPPLLPLEAPDRFAAAVTAAAAGQGAR